MTRSIGGFDARAVAFTTAILIALGVVVAFAGTAWATHPDGSSLEVLEEIDTNPLGATHTLTAQLYQGATGTPQAVDPSAAQVDIDFEVEAGPAIRADCAPQADGICHDGRASDDGNTPSTPDMSCEIAPGASSCTVVFTSDGSGTNVIRAFIDEANHDAGGANPTYDGSEGRYAGASDCGSRSTSPSGADSATCDHSGSTQLAPQPGATAEPDATDVVQKTWRGVTQCSDAIDNDGDGLVDMDDGDCSSPSDDSEERTVARRDARAACGDPTFQNTRTEIEGGGMLVVGTPGPDALRGSKGDDVICGLDGNDAIDGLDGSDLLIGQRDNDTITGGRGKDTIRGGAGEDALRGGGGNDAIDAGGGRDTVIGSKGNDLLVGGWGNDTIKGNAGIDTLRGGGGHDLLHGGRHDDVLKGEAGHDTLRGWTGNDAVDGGPGNDQCFGGKGNDSVRRCE